MTDVFVRTFNYLKDRKSADQALATLQRIASLVKPIMRKHGWVLPVLAEFFPDNPNLLGLNVNMGQKILLRLRYAHSPDCFLPEEDLVQTMLHELTHNVHGPHDDKFYKFLSGLQEEYGALQRSGYAGEGFFSKGNRLGTNVSHNLPPHLARQRALAAAEKRKQTSQTLGGSARRLGGATNSDPNLSPRERAARAAERRIQDEKACGQGQIAQQEADKAAKESFESKIIDLTLDDSDEEVLIVENDAPVPGPSNIAVQLPKPALASKQRAAPKPSTSTRPVARKPPPINYTTKPTVSGSLSEWKCLTCTLINPPMSLQCDACLTVKPDNEQAGWTCLTCGEGGMPHDFWSCSFCGTIKSQS